MKTCQKHPSAILWHLHSLSSRGRSRTQTPLNTTIHHRLGGWVFKPHRLNPKIGDVFFYTTNKCVWVCAAGGRGTHTLFCRKAVDLLGNKWKGQYRNSPGYQTAHCSSPLSPLILHKRHSVYLISLIASNLLQCITNEGPQRLRAAKWRHQIRYLINVMKWMQARFSLFFLCDSTWPLLFEFVVTFQVLFESYNDLNSSLKY